MTPKKRSSPARKTNNANELFRHRKKKSYSDMIQPQIHKHTICDYYCKILPSSSSSDTLSLAFPYSTCLDYSSCEPMKKEKKICAKEASPKDSYIYSDAVTAGLAPHAPLITGSSCIFLFAYIESTVYAREHCASAVYIVLYIYDCHGNDTLSTSHHSSGL